MHPDHRYIEALRRRDERSIREIYKQHSAQTIRWVVSRGGSSDDAQDIFQEALVALFEKAQNVDFVLSCPLGALLHVICSRKWVDRIRQKSRDAGVRKEEEIRYETEAEGDVLVEAEEVLAEQAKHTRLRVAFLQLSELCQRLLTPSIQWDEASRGCRNSPNEQCGHPLPAQKRLHRALACML